MICSLVSSDRLCWTGLRSNWPLWVGSTSRDENANRSGDGSARIAVAPFGPAEVGQTVTLMGWAYRRRDHGGLIFIDLRDRDGVTQCIFNPGAGGDAHGQAEAVRSEFVLGVRGSRHGPAGRHGQPQARHGRHRGAGGRTQDLQRIAPLALPDRQRGSRRGRRDAAPEVPLSRHAASGGARGVPDPRPHLPGGAGLSARRGVHRGRDAVPHAVHSGGSPGLPRAEPASAGQLLRPASVAAALQAAPHGGGIRALLPDRALLPRRGSSPGPPARVHPDRHRDLLPRPR